MNSHGLETVENSQDFSPIALPASIAINGKSIRWHERDADSKG
ncbi:MAG: hypothetical protein R3243_16215 [Arenibacter latericius]|nr:hypothetical protein [Arenibacter latericius]